MSKGWYVVHTYSGYENKIEKTIRTMMATPPLEGVVFDIKVPSEEIVELKNGKKRTINRKFLPGYILVEMDLPDRGWKAACSEIRRIQGVTGFVGYNQAVKPQPIPQEEARSILQKAGEIKAEKIIQPAHSFVVGESVKIVDGPFDTFTGSIEEIYAEKQKLRVMVGIFGRNTPVEVAYTQVEKI